VSAPLPDRDVERLFAESRLGWLGRRAAQAVRASWLDSRCRSWITAFAADWRPLGIGMALRAAGWLAIVAAATTLIVQRLGGTRVEPSTSVLPVVVAAGGLVLSWLGARRSARDGRPGW
jgi:hypothetical protein